MERTDWPSSSSSAPASVLVGLVTEEADAVRERRAEVEEEEEGAVRWVDLGGEEGAAVERTPRDAAVALEAEESDVRREATEVEEEEEGGARELREEGARETRETGGRDRAGVAVERDVRRAARAGREGGASGAAGAGAGGGGGGAEVVVAGGRGEGRVGESMGEASGDTSPGALSRILAASMALRFSLSSSRRDLPLVDPPLAVTESASLGEVGAEDRDMDSEPLPFITLPPPSAAVRRRTCTVPQCSESLG
jgi:hypothetical protein